MDSKLIRAIPHIYRSIGEMKRLNNNKPTIKQEIETVLRTVITTTIEECPVCGEKIEIEKTEHFKDDETEPYGAPSEKVVSELKNGKIHAPVNCIEARLYQVVKQNNFRDTTPDQCYRCDYYEPERAYCGTTPEGECTYPEHTFEMSKEMIAFNNRVHGAHLSHGPVIRFETWESGLCDHFKQERRR